MLYTAGCIRRTLMVLVAGTFALVPQMKAAGQMNAADVPGNISGNLRRLIAMQAESPSVGMRGTHLALDAKTQRYQLLPGKPNFFVDAQNRVLIRVVLNGSAGVSEASAAVERMGGQVVASSAFARGSLSAYLPLANASALAQAPGIQALHLSVRPMHNVGKVTAQSVVALDVDKVLAKGITGKGVTVGILSDSYDTSGNADTAAVDVASGDLPNTTAIKGGEGLKALIEEAPSGRDEGRGMAQIVHDMAPGAQLCFATTDYGQDDFALNILKLADDKGPCNADVIVDDAFYYAEPFFSDGILADAIDAVSKIRKSDGSRVAYFTSAGNGQGSGYQDFFHSVSVKEAEKQGTPVKLGTIPSSIDLGGGLHNFGSAENVVVAQPLFVVGDPVMILQWNDPFDVGKITSSYDLLLFDAQGNFIQASDTADNASSADNAFLIDEPIQGIAFDTSATGGSATYYLVIARSSEGSHEAKRLKWLSFGGGEIYAPYETERTPVVVGHSGAKHAISVAAYDVSEPPFNAEPPYTPELEDFTSPGPFFNYFDDAGNRLPEVEVRQKPDIACTDGLFTTFFGQQILPTDVYFRFFGTSAAAPCAASVGALMINKGLAEMTPRHPEPGEILAGLKNSVQKHDVDPFVTKGAIFGDGGELEVRAHGNNRNIQDPSDFRVTLTNAPEWSLTSLRLKIPAHHQFDFFQTASYPFLVGNTSPGVGVTLKNLGLAPGVQFVQSNDLDLAFTGFTSGDFAEFDVDRADSVVGYIDDDADRLGKTRFEATLTNKKGRAVTVSGELTNEFGDLWNRFDGYGLINAEFAVASVQ